MEESLPHVCIVNKFDWLKPGPMGIMSVMMGHALAAAGCTVTLFSAGEPNQCWRQMLCERFGLAPLANFTIEVIPRGRLGKVALWFYARACARILALSRQGCARLVILTRNTNFLPFLSFLRLFTKSKTYFETHSYHGRKTDVKRRRKITRKALPLFLIERWFLPVIHGILCITRPQQRLYRIEFPGVPSVYLPLGARVSEKIALSGGESRRNRMAYIGGAPSHIDAEGIFAAIAQVRNSAISLTWIGADGAVIPALRSTAAELAISGQVHFREWLGHAQMLELLGREFGFGLACYKNVFQTTMLTCPTKILDYFSVGIPVIASRLPAITGMLEDGVHGFLYTPQNSGSLACALSLVVRMSEDEYIRMRLRCLETARWYSWENRAKRFLAFARR